MPITDRAFAAHAFAESIAAEVNPSHKIADDLKVVLLALKGEFTDKERIYQAGSWLSQRSDILHFPAGRAAQVAYAGHAFARFCRTGDTTALEVGFMHLAALRLPDDSHKAMWDFLRGDRDDSALHAQWEAFRARAAAEPAKVS